MSSPILLLRPLGGSTLSWGPFKDALEERLRVITFDPRPRATTRAMAEDAARVLDEFGSRGSNAPVDHHA